MTRSAATVYLVDDEAAVLKGLERLIRSAGFRTKPFLSAKDFLGSRIVKSPRCLILDVQMPELSGLDLQQELAAREISLPIIFLTGHGDIPMSVQAMKAGAVNFLTKPARAEDLLAAVREAIVLDKKTRREHAKLDSIRLRFDTLTAREAEVFRLVARGTLNKQVAYELGIAEKTVKVHRARVMAKMKADSLADLVRLAELLGQSPPTKPAQPSKAGLRPY